LHIAESKAFCPHCEQHIPFNVLEKRWMKQDNHFMKFKCKCGKNIGIAMDMRGDYVAFDLII
jgi:hypothetical protein